VLEHEAFSFGEVGQPAEMLLPCQRSLDERVVDDGLAAAWLGLCAVVTLQFR